MLKSAVCPDVIQYQRLASAELTDAEKETLLGHLKDCDACAQKLSSLPEPDTLVGLIRHAKTLDDRASESIVARLVERLSELRPGAAAAKSEQTLSQRDPIAPMPMTFACPACGKGVKVKPDLVRKKVKCPHCKATVRVPGGPAGPKQRPQPTSAPADANKPSPERPLTKVAPAIHRSATANYHPAGTTNKELYDFLNPPQAPDELGRLGTYRVLQVLGAGGMGVVFRAEDPHLARLVALKAMLPALAASDSARQRFLREARAIAAIKHDHIVSVYQVGEDHDVPFLAMEFLEGESLDARLRREGKLSVPDVLRIGRQIASGLAAAHKRGLIHRDIKPANIFLENADCQLPIADSQPPQLAPPQSAIGNPQSAIRVKILDFGLARATGEEGQITQQGTILGTPEYMAPEQVEGKSLDHACDLFSLGCVLYRMGTGVPAFKGTDMISTLMAVATETPRSPQELGPELPPALSQLIMALLAKDRRQRPPSAQAVADALEQIAQAEAPQSASFGHTRPSAATKLARNKRLFAAVVAASVLLVGLVGLWAAGVIMIKTTDGTIVLENLSQDAEVLVDGGRALVTWGDRDNKAEIRVKPGTHEVEVKKGSLVVASRKMTVAEGGRELFTVEYLPGGPASDGKPPPERSPVQPDAERRAAQWVLSLGGAVSVHLKGADVEVRADGKLPTEPFALRRIDLSCKVWGSNPELDRAVKAGDGLAHLAGLTNLVAVDLHNTPVSDAAIAHLKGLTNLTSLSVQGARVTDAGLEHLRGFSKLRDLYIQDTKITSEGIAALKKALPECRVHNDPMAGAVASGPSRAYMNRGGVWKIDRDELVQEDTLGDCQLVFGDFTWSDYDFSLEAKKATGSSEIVLLYRSSGAGSGVFALPGIRNGNAYTSRSVGRGIHLRLKDAPGTWDVDRWHQLRVRLRGPHCQCFCDEQLVLDFEDNRHRQGAVGLRTSFGAVRFRNLRVTDADGKLLFQGLPQLPPSTGQWPPATDPPSDHELICLKGHNCPVTAVTFSSDGRQVLSCSDGETTGFNTRQGPVRWYSPASSLRLWDVAAGKELDFTAVKGGRGFVKLARAANAPLFVSHIRDWNRLGLWSMADGKLRSLAELPVAGLTPGYHGIFDLAFTPDSRRVRALSQKIGTIWEWDVTDRIFLRQVPGAVADAACTAIAPDAKHALLARKGQPFAELDLDTGKETGRWKQPAGVIRSMAFSADGSRLVSGAEDGTIRLWEMAGAKHVALIGVHPRPVLATAISPDGRQALTAGEDQTVRLWDLDAKKELAAFTGHTREILAVAFSPDGRTAASGSADYTVRLWRLPATKR